MRGWNANNPPMITPNIGNIQVLKPKLTYFRPSAADLFFTECDFLFGCRLFFIVPARILSATLSHRLIVTPHAAFPFRIWCRERKSFFPQENSHIKVTTKQPLARLLQSCESPHFARRIYDTISIVCVLSDIFSTARHAVHKTTPFQRLLSSGAMNGGVLRALAVPTFVQKPNLSLL